MREVNIHVVNSIASVNCINVTQIGIDIYTYMYMYMYMYMHH